MAHSAGKVGAAIAAAGLALGLSVAPALAQAAGPSAEVDLVVEPLASTPPAYTGKPMVPLGGNSRVVAFVDFRAANGTRLDATALDYEWNVDGVNELGDSGVGKRAILVDSPLEYHTHTVTVTVATQDGTLTGTGSATLTASEPVLRVYARDPLIGVRFESALESSFALSGSEATFYAAPYSFPTALSAPLLSWYVSGSLVQTGNLVTLRPTGQGAGSAAVSVTAASRGSLDAPGASNAFSISFGSSGGSGLFGL